LFIAGTLRACWILGLAFVRPGVAVLATYRLDQTERDRVARILSAWSISSSTTIAVFTALWGALASLTSPRTAIATAGVLILATPLLLPRQRQRRSRSVSGPAVMTNPLA
jgi:hypothetical protein